MLQPKRVKYRKVHRGRRAGAAHSGNTVAFGEYGLRADANAWITARQIEATRRVFVRFLRHGGGKGAPEEWVAVVKRGRIMFELAGIGEEAAKKAIRLASYKLPIGTSLVAREVSDVEI